MHQRPHPTDRERSRYYRTLPADDEEWLVETVPVAPIDTILSN